MKARRGKKGGLLFERVLKEEGKLVFAKLPLLIITFLYAVLRILGLWKSDANLVSPVLRGQRYLVGEFRSLIAFVINWRKCDDYTF